jgi:hypothetical protein
LLNAILWGDGKKESLKKEKRKVEFEEGFSWSLSGELENEEGNSVLLVLIGGEF